MVLCQVANRTGLLSRPSRFLKLHQHRSLFVAVSKRTDHPFHGGFAVVGLPVLKDGQIDVDLGLADFLSGSSSATTFFLPAF